MSITHQLLTRTAPHYSGSLAADIIRREASKGCEPVINIKPIVLEPLYSPPNEWLQTVHTADAPSNISSRQQYSEHQRYIIWIPSYHELDWVRAERFIKILSGASHRIGFEISGNQTGITFSFMVHPEDTGILHAACIGEYSRCTLSPMRKTSEREAYTWFKEFFPHPPYHHLLSQPIEFEVSPFDSFIRTLAILPEDVNAITQIIFEPARCNWHRNVEALTDLEYRSRGIEQPSRYGSRSVALPSSDLRDMAQDVSLKAHTDKPFFFTAIRVGIIGENSYIPNEALAAFARIFRHGGAPLQELDSNDYRQAAPEALQTLFSQGETYHPGFLVNSAELAGLVHLPTMTSFSQDELPIDFLETITVQSNSRCLSSGLTLGSYWEGDTQRELSVQENIRMRGNQIIGVPDSGKSSHLKHQIMQDINAGEGIGFIDPHGDCIEDILTLIPEERVKDTIYIDFGNPEWIPIFNPLLAAPGQDISRTANMIVTAVKSYIADTGWGDRLENILRFGFHAMLSVPGMTFLDLFKLLQPPRAINKKERNRIKELVLNSVKEATAFEFWQNEFDSYRKDDLAPPKHKITKLIFAGPVAVMLSQPENRLSIRDIMSSRKILLMNLSKLESEQKSILGSFLMALFHEAAISRSQLARAQRNPFYLYCDEAHLITAGNIEHMLTDLRKYRVSLTLAHQNMRQFHAYQHGAITGTGTSIIFRTNADDAQYLAKQLLGKAVPDDIIGLKQHQAIVRIDNEVARITTGRLFEGLSQNYRDLIISRSRQQYCRHIKNIVTERFLPDELIHSFEESGVFSLSVPPEHMYEELS